MIAEGFAFVAVANKTEVTQKRNSYCDFPNLVVPLTCSVSKAIERELFTNET